jgi:hypothetical protein
LRETAKKEALKTMIPEQRLDRLERIAKLMTKAGPGERRPMREMDEKIAIVIDMQIKSEERFARVEERLTAQDQKIGILLDLQMKNEERFARNEVRFTQLAESQQRLAESQTHTDRRLDALIDIIREGHNGKPPSAS